MARAEWGRAKWCYSYKRTTLVVCFINIAVALYVLHSLYSSLYLYPYGDTRKAFRYTPDQIRKMEESILIRKESEPIELINLVRALEKEFLSQDKAVELPKQIRQEIADEILTTLRSLNASGNTTMQREAVKSWRKKKLKEAKKLIHEDTSTSTITPNEADVLLRALEYHWDALLETIGVWFPVQVIHEEHDDKPEGEDEFDSDVLPGRQLPLECHAELHTDYGGAAVRWGLTHHKDSAYDCCMTCLDQAKRAKPSERKCNIWVYCPLENGCHSPDIYEHKHGECWLKYDEQPKVSFKDRYSESYRNAHPNAPLVVPWVSGVVSV